MGQVAEKWTLNGHVYARPKRKNGDFRGSTEKQFRRRESEQ